MWMLNRIRFSLCAVPVISIACRGADLSTNNPAEGRVELERPVPSLWESGMGEGFRSSAQSVSLEAGAVNGIAILGGVHAHDIALTTVSYGHMLGHTVGEGHFYRGNWELRGELFGGVEFAPSSEWVIGAAPHLRYNFATGTRFVPYIDAGAGVTATSIGPPDLSNIFEFNLQGTAGLQIFLQDNLALTVEARFLHMSCAGISDPNRGVNGVAGLIGLTFLF